MQSFFYLKPQGHQTCGITPFTTPLPQNTFGIFEVITLKVAWSPP
jgi:hypothetical protein